MNGAGLRTREHTKYNITMSSAGTWRDSNIHYEFTMDDTLWTGEWWLIHETRKILWQTITPEFGLAAVANIGDLRLKLWHSELKAEHGLWQSLPVMVKQRRVVSVWSFKCVADKLFEFLAMFLYEYSKIVKSVALWKSITNPLQSDHSEVVVPKYDYLWIKVHKNKSEKSQIKMTFIFSWWSIGLHQEEKLWRTHKALCD